MWLTVCAAVVLAAQSSFTPARYAAGPLPPVPIQAVGGGEVYVELTVSAIGHVDRMTLLRTTPPFVDPFVAAVRTWQFRPAEDEDSSSPLSPKPLRRVESTVLVAGLFRPPALNAPTLGASPIDVAPGSDDIPHPIATVTPLYPPEALFGGIVLVEVEIDTNGLVTKTTVARSAPPFDQPAIEAARRWTFRPAHSHSRPVSAVAYIVFSFRQPVTTPRLR